MRSISARALDYTCQICNAMDHAHRQGVIHRDLRPGNVLVTENGMAKVADFGTSRFLEIAAHGTTVIGSPPYMAPEQFQGKAVFSSDIYSLGVTMYQMLTGSLPYNTPSPGDLERLIKGELTPPPRDAQPKIPKGISDIVMKAMAPEITARYQRAADVLDAVLAARASARPRPATPPVAAEAATSRRPWRPAPLDNATAANTWTIFRRGSKRAKHRKRDSAGTAARRSTRGPINARFAERRSRRPAMTPDSSAECRQISGFIVRDAQRRL